MISKVRQIWTVFKSQLLKGIRKGHMKQENFIGRYVDIEIDRRQWVGKNGCIIVGKKDLETGVRKVHQQIIFYVEDSIISKWLGFKKNKTHYILAGWYKAGISKPSIGGITLEGETA